jgi:hypothetical protein
VATLLVLIIEAGYSWPKLDGAACVMETLLGWSMPVYNVVAMRRVFRRGWFGTLLKGVALFFVYMIVFAATIAGTIVYTAFRL